MIWLMIWGSTTEEDPLVSSSCGDSTLPLPLRFALEAGARLGLVLEPSFEDLARGLSPAESFDLPRALTGLPSGGVCGVEGRTGVGVGAVDRGESGVWAETGDPDGDEDDDEDEGEDEDGVETPPIEAGATKLGSLGRTN